MASLFDAFTPQPSATPMPSAYQQTSGYQPVGGYQPTQTAPASAAPSGGRLTAPTGMQDMYDSFQAGEASKPLINSATGQALDKTGQVDESQVDKRTLWSRLGIGGRLGAGLETGALLASMVPSGKTIGENIAGVSGAIHNLPYAELLHQYQMSQPGLERMKEMLGLQQTQAETQLKQSQAGYYSTKNQAGILAQQLRGQSAEQLRAQAGKSTPKWGVATEDGVSPHGEPFKKGDRVWGYETPEYIPGNPQDMTDPGSLKRNFNAMSTEDEEMKARWGMGGGGSYQQHYINEYTQQFPKGRSGNLTNPVDLQNEALDDYKAHSQTMPGIAILQGGAGIPTRPQNPQVDRSKSDQEEYKQTLLPEKSLKPSEAASLSPDDRKMYGLDPDPLNPNFMQDAGKVSDFSKNHNQQIAQYKSQYERLPQNQQNGFQKYLIDQGYNPKTKQFTKNTPTVPQVGEIRNGYRYKGGEPGLQTSWELAQ